MPLNYRLGETTEDTFVFEGDGMIRRGQNPLLGATKIVISISNEILELSCDLGGVVRSNLFFLIFPPALMVFLGILFYFQGMGTQAVIQTPIITLLWLILSPVVCFFIKKRTEKALDTLAHNIVNA